MTSPGVTYVSAEELRRALKLRDTSDPRLDRCCVAVSDAIDWMTGHTERMDPTPASVAEVALAMGVDTYKQPDAGFGIVGMAETGPVRVPREVYKRFVEQLAPYTVAFGLA